jgi:hypothetical protein
MPRLPNGDYVLPGQLGDRANKPPPPPWLIQYFRDDVAGIKRCLREIPGLTWANFGSSAVGVTFPDGTHAIYYRQEVL